MSASGGGDAAEAAAATAVPSYLGPVPWDIWQFFAHIEEQRCPTELEGRWRIDSRASQGLCPFLKGLGLPGVVCPAVGLLERTTELTISCPGPSEGPNEESREKAVARVRIEDKTAFSSRNVTEVTLDGEEAGRCECDDTGISVYQYPAAARARRNSSSYVVLCTLASVYMHPL